MKSPRESRRADRSRRQRSDVLEAATSIFADKGFDGAQMGAIARLAELSLATVYGMFPSKEALYHEVVADTARAMRRTVTQKVEPVSDPGERLMALIDALLDCYQDNLVILKIYAHGAQGLPYKIRESMGEDTRQLYQEFTRWVTGVAEEARSAGKLSGLDPATVANALIGTVTTTCAQWIERDAPPPLTDAGPPIRALFRRLITPNS